MKKFCAIFQLRVRDVFPTITFKLELKSELSLSKKKNISIIKFNAKILRVFQVRMRDIYPIITLKHELKSEI